MSRSSPILCPRFVGTPVQPEDLDDLCRLFADRRVMATLSSDGEPLPGVAVRQRLERAQQHWLEHGFGIWVFRTHTGRFVGRAGLQNKTILGRQEIELLYALEPAFWGRGAATEIAGSLVRAAFGPLRLEELISFALTHNRASRRVMEKVGFAHERDFVHVGLPHALYRQRARNAA